VRRFDSWWLCELIQVNINGGERWKVEDDEVSLSNADVCASIVTCVSIWLAKFDR